MSSNKLSKECPPDCLQYNSLLFLYYSQFPPHKLILSQLHALHLLQIQQIQKITIVIREVVVAFVTFFTTAAVAASSSLCYIG
jgi:hypothetical protein